MLIVVVAKTETWRCLRAIYIFVSGGAGSLEPQLSILDFVSQLWRKLQAARQNPEQARGLRLVCWSPSG